MTLERGSKEREHAKITIADGRCWPECIFSFKMDETRSSKHLAESLYLFFTHHLCLNCAEMKERMQIRTSDPELIANMRSIQFLWALRAF